jgi:hypothetical protein
MSVMGTIQRFCTQKAVYWGNPAPDGYGGYTYDNPVEIDCRWEDRKDLITDNDGNQIVSRARVFVTQDLNEQGWLYLGDLDDLDSAPTPKESGAYQIKRFDRVPAAKSTTEFVRIAYL